MSETADPPPGAGADTVLGKAMLVLRSFSVERTTLTFTDLRKTTGLTKGTLHRLLGELVRVGLLDRVESHYRLSGLVFELGMRASVERGLLEVSIPFMEDLYELTHETIQLGIRDGSDVVYVAKLGGHRQARSKSRLGGRMPLHATAIGKALLAFSPGPVKAEVLTSELERVAPRTLTAPGLLHRQIGRIVDEGVAFEHEESSPGIACVAAPVLDADGYAVAALSVTGPISRFRPERHAAGVRVAASGIAAVLAHHALRSEG
jgi:DNA-binding IclR family transcriptional regulator